jgi:Fic family protein
MEDGAEELPTGTTSPLDSQYIPPPSFAAWSAGISLATETLERYREILSAERAQADEASVKRAFDIAMRAAAIETGAIEGLYQVDRGFTYTVAAQEAAWEAMLEEKGAEASALIDSQLSAYELVLDAATNHTPISEAWIRRVHEELCRNQATYEARTPAGVSPLKLVKGKYKQFPNHVLQPDGTEHAYAPVIDTPEEMHRLVSELGTSVFQSADATLQAAYAHYALVAIHPFADGNGRVARALASVFTYRAHSIPLVIYADQRADYFRALAGADVGIQQPFAIFVMDRELDTLGEIAQELRTARQVPAEDSVAAINALRIGHGGLDHAELDTIAQRLLRTLHDTFRSEIEGLTFPPALGHNEGFRISDQGTPTGYRPLVSQQPTILHISLNSQPPASAVLEMRFQVGVSTDKDGLFAFILQRLDQHDFFEVRLGEMYPDVGQSLTRRMSIWVKGILSEAMDRLRQDAQASLKGAGYPVPE